MRKYLAYSLLLAVLFGNSGAGCGSKNSDDPQPDKFQSLIGKWEAIRFNYEFTEQNGTIKNTGTELKSKGTIIIWEFFSDGRLKVTGNTNNNGAIESREVRWSLNVKKVDVNGDINDGTLTIIGDQERQFAQTLGQAGDLTYDIGTIAKSAAPDGKTKMYLLVDVTKVGPYKKNTLTYIYDKQ
ncbi:hypothetical protein [Spirosoma sp. KNUC1025]|uniref:hypothetical protein n=1 Tax=Spirosoma sp. KNUC1025 TaxID=2894082 RepID=UPI00386C6B0A|nr:hypothetical protein LN737_25900 [Spirosoma sp. KNUC1025]